MAEITRHIREPIAPFPFTLRIAFSSLTHQRIHQVSQVAFILRGCLEHLAGELGEVFLRVVADTEEFDEDEPLGGSEGEVGGCEFEDDFVGGGVGFAEVGGVAEAKGGGGGWGLEGDGEFLGGGG